MGQTISSCICALYDLFLNSKSFVVQCQVSATVDNANALCPSSSDDSDTNSEISEDSTLSGSQIDSYSQKKVLILDLDETLIHSNCESKQPMHSYTVEVPVDASSWYTFFVAERPHLDRFLRKVCRWYDVFIFTASTEIYARSLIDRIDRRKGIKGTLYRESCTRKKTQYVKDISKICSDLTNCIIVDNSPISYERQPDNAVPIKSWNGTDPADEALLDLLPLLEGLRHIEDVRSVLGLRTLISQY
eukprot:gb/GECH01008744.1/.p1 GENE.gb/GECH01008744.1/~~gb/GECH01008744.1/.p1  ORF type:complete len:246 (+),score=32.19 gb/GECH01008744.1/:1-738(+)